jgi:predicted aldo/keto reductase-like oxidoreductase
MEDVETILSPGGALETFLKARDAGKTRFIGFSAHSVEAALALMDRFDFDTILFPVNFRTWHAGNFGPQVLEMAQKKKMGILALKAMAGSRIPSGAERVRPKCWYDPLIEPEDAALGLNFTLSHPVTAAIPPGDEELFQMALELAGQFSPLTQSQTIKIKAMAMQGEPIFTYPSAQA